MPQIIHPRVTGTVSIELSTSDAHVLLDAIDKILERPATEWQDRKIGETVNGETVFMFVKALKGAM